MRSILIVPIFLALATPGFASDGVLEINQVCAVSAGCFPGDAAGFPVTVSQSGSYRLTSNLTVPNENTTAVSVTASSVTFDLGGFEIRGPNSCAGLPPPGPFVTCTLTGTGHGVEVLGDRSRIFNGSVRGMGSVGIYAPATGVAGGHVVHDVRVSHNRYQGIRLDGDSAAVRNVTAMLNGERGIYLTGRGGAVEGNTVSTNGSSGIAVGAHTIVSGNSVYGNALDGITTNLACTIQGNIAGSNGGFGLNLDFASDYKANKIVFNVSGTVLGGINMGGNSCEATATCP